jgi:hypothetical protein
MERFLLLWDDMDDWLGLLARLITGPKSPAPSTDRPAQQGISTSQTTPRL